MTIEERDTARAIQTIARKMREPKEIDWEQRRYEIAKDAMAAMIAQKTFAFTEDVASDAVNYADVLVKELKNNPLKNGI